MFRVISYNELSRDIDNCILIDVRSEDEYLEATIPGAINIPILVNHERIEVGTLYKQKGVQVAKEVGIEYVSKRLPEIFRKIEKIYNDNKGKKIVLFCARGGMRSGSIYSLMNSLGSHLYKLQGGYKGYRQFLNEELKKQCEDIKLITLYGNTGIGKTEILEKLKEKGYDILDLEGAANHRGSLLGGVGLGNCHSQKMFESLVYEELRKRKTNLIFTEGESKRIGRIVMADFLWNKIMESENVYITADLDFRAKRLVKEYTECENSEDDILSSLEKLKKYMNEERVENYKTLIKEHNFYDVAKDLMIKYYDPMYMGASKKREFLDKIHIESIDEAVSKLIEIYEKISDGENIETINGSEFLEEIN